jgi:hypothetical protein
MGRWAGDRKLKLMSACCRRQPPEAHSKRARSCVRRQRDAYAPQVPGAARGPQKLPSPLTEITSVLGSRIKVIGPAGVSTGSLVAFTTPDATSPDEEIRYPLALSPPVMTLLEILSQGGGLSEHHR